MSQTVILYDSIGFMFEPDVVLFDDFHDPVPYIKEKLKTFDIYDERYQKDLNEITRVEEAQCFIDEYRVSTVKVFHVSCVNPEAG